MAKKVGLNIDKTLSVSSTGLGVSEEFTTQMKSYVDSIVGAISATGGNFLGEWNPDGDYVTGDIVIHDATMYIAWTTSTNVTPGMVGGAWTNTGIITQGYVDGAIADASSFLESEIVVQSSVFPNGYDPETPYNANDLAVFNNKIYRSVFDNNTTQQPDENPYGWVDTGRVTKGYVDTTIEDALDTITTDPLAEFRYEEFDLCPPAGNPLGIFGHIIAKKGLIKRVKVTGNSTNDIIAFNASTGLLDVVLTADGNLGNVLAHIDETVLASEIIITYGENGSDTSEFMGTLDETDFTRLANHGNYINPNPAYVPDGTSANKSTNGKFKIVGNNPTAQIFVCGNNGNVYGWNQLADKTYVDTTIVDAIDTITTDPLAEFRYEEFDLCPPAGNPLGIFGHIIAKKGLIKRVKVTGNSTNDIIAFNASTGLLDVVLTADGNLGNVLSHIDETVLASGIIVTYGENGSNASEFMGTLDATDLESLANHSVYTNTNPIYVPDDANANKSTVGKHVFKAVDETGIKHEFICLATASGVYRWKSCAGEVVVTEASTSSPTPNADITDMYVLTTLDAAATFGVPTGTPVDGQKLMIRIKDNGTSRTLSWNSIYTAVGITLPAATTANKYTYVGMVYNSQSAAWDCIATATQS